MGKQVLFTPKTIEPTEPQQYTLRFFPDGTYFGGSPEVTYTLFQNECVNQKPISDTLETLYKDENIVVSFSEVTLEEIDNKTIILPSSSKRIIASSDTEFCITDGKLSIDELQDKWWKIMTGQVDDYTSNNMVNGLIEMMNAKDEFIDTLFLSLKRDIQVNGHINDEFIDNLLDTFINKDLNILFIDRYVDYIENPQNINRTFSYRGIHI